MKKAWLICCLVLFAGNTFAQTTSPVVTSDSIVFPGLKYTSIQDKWDEVYIFSPVEWDSTKTLSLTIFLHGYSGFRPEVYGGWINDIAQQGSVVIFPVYQNSMIDVPSQYYEHAVKQIHMALNELKNPGYPKVDTTKAIYAGHSLGGSMTMKLINHLTENNLPKPYAALLAQPGSGMLHIIEDKAYNDIPRDVLLLCFTGKSDHVTDDIFTKKVLAHTDSLPLTQKFHFRLINDRHEHPSIESDHLTPCGYLDIVPLSGHLIATGAIAVCEIDKSDTEIYWETTAILLEMMKNNLPATAFNKHIPALLNIGTWPDGEAIHGLEQLPVE